MQQHSIRADLKHAGTQLSSTAVLPRLAPDVTKLQPPPTHRTRVSQHGGKRAQRLALVRESRQLSSVQQLGRQLAQSVHSIHGHVSVCLAEGPMPRAGHVQSQVVAKSHSSGGLARALDSFACGFRLQAQYMLLTQPLTGVTSCRHEVLGHHVPQP